ncbi:D-lactate dehydrogenase [Mesocricetibacter intestinalis]|uniref:D-lactate dehydrogenase n=1 Tax=Mesocricetibacter intestinalis TaxID=1521930 RepID=UPI00105CA0AB|nr:D-lactate dehydrogenase [Mesocricetibacter intestinalis]
MSTQQAKRLISTLTAIVTSSHIITEPEKTEAYRSGYRFGTGNALAVVRPADLLEFWRVLKACVEQDAIIINQAANTGLTGGSTPSGNDYERPVIIINTMRITHIQPINNGQQVVCFPGSTLNQLENILKPYGREPHSVIGSSCIGASVIGGICNNSGGALVQRGPAYTEMALFAQLNENGELELKNHLGIHLGDDAEEILTNLQNHHYRPQDIEQNCGNGHDHNYCHHVRQVNEDSPARFNADPARHYEASGSAGKIAVFAVRLDTFLLERDTAVFYIGTNQTSVLNDLRRHILSNFAQLPISGEYIHRDAFDIAARYGKDTFWVIKKFGTDRLPKLFKLKANVDRLSKKFAFLPSHLSDKFMQLFAKFLPEHLPRSLWQYRDRYEHHLILKMGGTGVQEARDYLADYFKNSEKGGYFECNARETQAAMLHRFAVASAAIRYRAVHSEEVEEIVALDVALRRNDADWFENLPAEINGQIIHKLYYGHFICHVFHQDYIIKKGCNTEKLEEEMLKILEQRGAQYPAEHNVGHLYTAKPELRKFYQSLDPTNSFNPGIGKTSKKKYWQ